MAKKADETRSIDRVLDRAEKRGWNKSKLADKMGVLPQHVNNWFKRGLPADQLGAAADALDCTVDELLGRTKTVTVTKGACAHADIPQRRIDLIRMYGRLPDEVRQPIRALIETLAFMGHEHKGEYVARVSGSKKPLMVHEK